MAQGGRAARHGLVCAAQAGHRRQGETSVVSARSLCSVRRCRQPLCLGALPSQVGMAGFGAQFSQIVDAHHKHLGGGAFQKDWDLTHSPPKGERNEVDGEARKETGGEEAGEGEGAGEHGGGQGREEKDETGGESQAERRELTRGRGDAGGERRREGREARRSEGSRRGVSQESEGRR